MIKLPDELKALVDLANQLKGEKWTYSRTTPYSRGYITGNGGRTIVQTYDGEVPANVCRYFELADPATILSIADKIQRLNATAHPVSDDNNRIADALESLLWPNMAIGNKVVILAVIKALRSGTAQPVSDGWVKCSDRMPVQHQSNRYVPMNLLLNERTVIQGGFDNGEFWMEGAVIKNVTRWMPLPAAPGGQD